MSDPYQCVNCVYELDDQFGGPDPDCNLCIDCYEGDNFLNIDAHGAHAQGKGRFLGG